MHSSIPDFSEWRFWGRWKSNVFCNAQYSGFSLTQIFKDLSLPPEFRDWYLSVDGYLYTRDADHRIFDKFIIDKFLNDSSWFDKLFNLAEKIEYLANNLKRDGDVVSCMKLLKDNGCITMLIHFCDKGLEKLVPEIAAQSGLTADQFAKILIPFKHTYTMQYKEALYQLKMSKISIDDFIKDFEWFGTGRLSGNGLTILDIQKELRKTMDKESAPNIDIKSLDKEIKSKIIILQKLIYFRSLHAELAGKMVYYQWAALDNVALRHSLRREDLGVLTPEEIIYLTEKNILPIDTKKRLDQNGLECSGVSYINGVSELYFGDELKQVLKIFEPKLTTDQKIVHGNIAFKGKVKGFVKIIEDINDLKKINEGDVIVSPETMPDYIVGMKKAAAFVTNQGGITSHAAIVAREMKKPCIIGTKIATQVFKDGDLVEVDANVGIIRIIS
ncbi:MAG: PEP-utilizing enzyme [Candidatus Paceibacterota bacterium]